MSNEHGTTILWRLRAKRSVAKCVLSVHPAVAELLILQDEELAIREPFPDQDTACLRAQALHDALVERGWRDGLDTADGDPVGADALPPSPVALPPASSF